MYQEMINCNHEFAQFIPDREEAGNAQRLTPTRGSVNRDRYAQICTDDTNHTFLKE